MTISRRIVASFPACAGLFGALGIGISAAAAHLGGSEAARTAGTFLILHAVALVGLAALSGPTQSRRSAVTGLILIIGTGLFCGDLALAGLFDLRPIPKAAPFGGSVLIVGWLVLPVWEIAVAVRGGKVRE